MPFTVAIVGRPNVGKSTLFNRLVGGAPALVEDAPGVTRDRRYGEVESGGRTFTLIDTGGLDPGARAGLAARIRGQIECAVAESELALLVVDARAGVTALDRDAAAWLRRSGRPFLVAANKIDHERVASLSAEAHALGAPVVAVSAAHGRAVGDLVDAILARAPDAKAPAAPAAPAAEAAPGEAVAPAGEPGPGAEPAPPGPDAPIGLALVGRPNAGKSSLLNRLVGHERALVDPEPGTTRDEVDETLRRGGALWRLVDTAGMRRPRSVRGGPAVAERQAVSRAVRAIERCDVCALVIDASADTSEQDARLAALAVDRGRALIVVLNKWDLCSGGRADRAARRARTLAHAAERLRFCDWAPVLRVSAKTGAGVSRLLSAALAACRASRSRVATAEVNRALREAVGRVPPPSPGGRPLRLYYGTQAGSAPPTFMFSCNRPDELPEAWRRHLERRMREAFGFEGTPVRLRFRGR